MSRDLFFHYGLSICDEIGRRIALGDFKELNIIYNRVEQLKEIESKDSLDKLIDTNKTFINFKEKIENNIKEDKYSVIAEIKKASPSAGVIIKDYDPVDIANIYNKNKATSGFNCKRFLIIKLFLKIKDNENVDINPSLIQLSKEIKSLGTFGVILNLHSEIQSQIKIKVVAQEENQ